MDGRHNGKYFNDLLDRRRDSAGVIELIADDREEVILPMSASSCADLI